jgi:hypothetical protein
MLGFLGSPTGEADKIVKKIIKILMFIGYVYHLTDVHNLCLLISRGT